MTSESDVQRIKREKRNRRIEPAPAGMTRRRFLTCLGAGSAALAAGSAGTPTGGAGGGGEAPVIGGVPEAQAAQLSSGRLSFTPIEATGEDDVVLPEGFKYDVVRKWGHTVIGDDAPYGYSNDYVAYFPIDALGGGRNSADGILWVNHEYPDPKKWVSDYQDPDKEDEKSPEQIAREKAAVGSSTSRAASKVAPGRSSRRTSTTAG